MNDANLDYDRIYRTGLPEVVFGREKTPLQLVEICASMIEKSGFTLATHVDAEKGSALIARFHDGRYDARGRCFAVGRLDAGGARTAVVSAGTSDLPVADECAFVLDAFGHEIVRQTDVGVAGIHRILGGIAAIDTCDAIVVVAGMEGALPTVVAGLVRAPVIAVPTSVGYGVAFGGVTALFGMLTSCAPGIAVVNIDNGFGAAALAHKIALNASRRSCTQLQPHQPTARDQG